jgi:hypothetical protein
VAAAPVVAAGGASGTAHAGEAGLPTRPRGIECTVAPRSPDPIAPWLVVRVLASTSTPALRGVYGGTLAVATWQRTGPEFGDVALGHGCPENVATVTRSVDFLQARDTTLDYDDGECSLVIDAARVALHPFTPARFDATLVEGGERADTRRAIETSTLELGSEAAVRSRSFRGVA